MSELIQINPSSATGKQYWRSLDALSQTPAFREWVDREFPEGASEMLSSGSRRTVLKLMAASFGLAGLTACRRPVEHILPLSKGSEGYIQGQPMHYATAATTGGVATGLIVETHDGRPTKVEGNPKHPFSLGATNSFQQALVLGLYDPDRAKTPQHKGTPATWHEFAAYAREQFSAAKLGQGEGLRILAEQTSSPSLGVLKSQLQQKFPQSKWIGFDSISFGNARAGAELAFGQALEAHYNFEKADVILALDCDFLGLDAQSILPVKQFSAKRRMSDPKSGEMSRLYAAEAGYSITGAMADHRLRLRASDAGAFAVALAKELNVSGAELKVLDGAAGGEKKFLTALAKDLLAHKGRSIVVAGPRQPAAVHALAAAINQALGNNGETVVYTQPAVAATDSLTQVKQLAADLQAGRVSTLLVLGGNPAYTLPADLDFANAMKKAGSTVALTADENETWAAAEWQLPEAHPFETWGDARALDGTVTIQQPLIEPLYLGKSALEVLAIVTGSTDQKGYDLVRNFWKAQLGADADKKWRLALRDGVVEGSAYPAVKATADLKKVLASVSQQLQPAAAGVEVVFQPSASVYDGRFANNAWLQEAPDPLTKLVWDNAAMISPRTAKELGVATGDVLSLSRNGRGIEVPAMIMPGQADNSIALTLGYGRSICGRVGSGVGHNVAPLRTTDAFHIATGVGVKKTGATYQLVTTQEHHSMEGRPIVLEATLDHYREHPEFTHHAVHLPEMISMFPDWDYSKGYQWGMSIDLNACIGCNACLLACNAENNIPVVGKDQVRRGREMHWIRMDRYFTGNEDDAQVVTQPMACVQCERAPCESVCPVAATVHSPEGLNEMAYNRCVGTRYCANNCPYKVRRFNFFNWNKDVAETRKMAFNPDVTVRMRGVMEKCNYCVQRIQEHKITAKAEGRRTLKDGEVVTACQQVCPADAIVFGNINDPESRVSKAKKQPRDYTLLEELNTKPRTTYLAKLRNPNPELA
jgi:MoCo/4Fe-4S cofactor protein with predicted Tat translocation signal